MLVAKRHVAALYVDRRSQQWIVRDPDGNFWIVPSSDDAWDHRQPFEPSEDAELQSVPSHYKYLLNLPF